MEEKRDIPLGRENVPLSAPFLIERLSWLLRVGVNSIFHLVSMYLSRTVNTDISRRPICDEKDGLLLQASTRDTSAIGILNDSFLKRDRG